MRSLYREPTIDASYQISVHLAKQFRKRSDGKSSHCLWQSELKRTNIDLQNTTQKTKDIAEKLMS
jgi:hypothetical protein